jgi:hypothetical protein
MNKLPDWFVEGAKVYLYGVTPAYTVTKIVQSEGYWIGKNMFGDPEKYPLEEVPACWSPVPNKENEPKLNAGYENYFKDKNK